MPVIVQDEWFEAHRFKIPPAVRRNKEKQLYIPKGLPIFLLNTQTRAVLGPFYAKEQTAARAQWVRHSQQLANL